MPPLVQWPATIPAAPDVYMGEAFAGPWG
jgi:hypothetical protein